MFLDETGSVIPQMSLMSRASSGVPGTVHGLLTAWKDHGSGNIRLQQLLAPAIKLADKGYVLSKRRADLYNYYKTAFTKNDAAAKIFIKHDESPWKQGDVFVQKDLAKTLKRISKFGISGFYNGTTAKLIVKEMKINLPTTELQANLNDITLQQRVQIEMDDIGDIDLTEVMFFIISFQIQNSKLILVSISNHSYSESIKNQK